MQYVTFVTYNHTYELCCKQIYSSVVSYGRLAFCLYHVMAWIFKNEFLIIMPNYQSFFYIAQSLFELDFFDIISGMLCQSQVSMAEKNNYTLQTLWV